MAYSSHLLADPGRHTRAYPFSLSLFTLFSLFWVLQHLTRISHFRYSPGSHISCTRPDSPFSVFARIPHFRYSPGFPISGTRPDFYLPGTRPDPTFPVLTRIPPFPVLTRILPFSILTRILCNTPKYTIVIFDMFRVFCKRKLNVS